MKTTQLTGTLTSKKEVIAEAIRGKVEELNKLLFHGYEHNLIILIDVDVDNLDDDNPTPLFKLETKIIEEIEY